MMKIRYGAIGLMAVLFSQLITLPSMATTIRKITLGESGDTESLSKPIPVALAPGQGVNISFLATDRHIVKVWLDNPNFAIVSSDGCLTGLDADCEKSTAKVIHLNRIKDLAIPGLPQVGSSALTVVTTNDNGDSNLYLFKVYKSKTVSDLLIQFEDLQIESSNQRATRESVGVELNLIAAIERGIEKSQANRWLSANSALAQKLTNFLNLLHSGTEVGMAAANSGVSLALVQRLQNLGGYTNLSFSNN